MSSCDRATAGQPETSRFRTAAVAGCDGGAIVVSDAGCRVLRLVSRSGYDHYWLSGSFAALPAEGPQGALRPLPGSSIETPLSRGLRPLARVFDPSGVGPANPATSVHAGLEVNNPGYEDYAFDVEPYAFGWRNYGGDRTWIAPEADLFWSDPNDIAGTYRVPEAFDPGTYRMESSAEGVRLFSEFALENRRLGGWDRLSLEKRVAPVPNPFHHARNAGDLLGAEYVGYRQTATLSLLSDGMPGHRVGMWHIAQVRAPGDILIPVSSPDCLVRYTEHTEGRDCFTVGAGLIRFRVGAEVKQKIGVKADALLGRMGFLRKCDDGLWSLIVRSFSADPSADYVDAPWGDPDDLGYAVQCYNDDGTLGDFGELEYHTPAIGHGTGMTSYSDSGNVWAFRGEESIIGQIASRLLTVRP